MSLIEKKSCAECGTHFTGRIDKRFCSDQCRSAFNNKRNTDDAIVRDVNRILRKNRRILSELNPSGKCRVNRDKMQTKGFDFAYYTSVYTTKDGAQYIYCYDQGYLKISTEVYLLVERKINTYP